jgi:hypothetical protein
VFPTKRHAAPRRRRKAKGRAAASAKSFGAKKLAVSFEAGLAAEIQQGALEETSGNVSAWLADAARQKIRQRALAQAVAVFEAEHGAITEEELAEADRAWPPA